MRDPARIDRITRKLAQVWKGTDSDQRLGQLVSNLHGLGVQEVFWTEDEELEAALDGVIERGVRDEKLDWVGSIRSG